MDKIFSTEHIDYVIQFQEEVERDSSGSPILRFGISKPYEETKTDEYYIYICSNEKRYRYSFAISNKTNDEIYLGERFIDISPFYFDNSKSSRIRVLKSNKEAKAHLVQRLKWKLPGIIRLTIEEFIMNVFESDEIGTTLGNFINDDFIIAGENMIKFCDFNNRKSVDITDPEEKPSFAILSAVYIAENVIQEIREVDGIDFDKK